MAILLENSVEDLFFFPPWIPYFADGRRILEKISMSIPLLSVPGATCHAKVGCDDGRLVVGRASQIFCGLKGAEVEQQIPHKLHSSDLT